MKKKGIQGRLPGTVNSIQELDDLGLEYAAIRDERMELSRKEVALKDKVHQCMKAHNRKTYKYGEVEIELIPGEEEVKVRVKKPQEQSPEDPDNTGENE